MSERFYYHKKKSTASEKSGAMEILSEVLLFFPGAEHLIDRKSIVAKMSHQFRREENIRIPGSGFRVLTTKCNKGVEQCKNGDA
jgi:ribosomal protein L31